LPDSLIRRANQILNKYENNEKEKDIIIQASLPLDDLMVENKSKVEEEIKNLNILQMTPIDALNTLYKLKEEVEKK